MCQPFAKELNRGQRARIALAKHLRNMGAAYCTNEVIVGQDRYEVTCQYKGHAVGEADTIVAGNGKVFVKGKRK